MHDDRTPILATAPLRISFVGGGTDFPHYFEHHGGAVLSATIDHQVRVHVAPRDDRHVRVRSLDLGRIVEYHLDEPPAYDGVMDLAKAAIARIGVEGGLDMAIASDAPPGSGLGGSSALVTAVVAGLAMLGGRSYTDHELAAVSHAIERDDLRISGGWQDQYAAAFGGINLLAFSAGGVAVEPVHAAPETLARLEANLLLCYTGSVRRHAGLIDAQIRLYEQGREETILGLKQLHQMAYAMRDAIESGELDELGVMLRDAFLAKKLMNPHIAEHTPIESMLTLAQAAGATGGKICGAGGGGYLLLYCRPSAQPSVREELERMGAQFTSFGFSMRGARAERGQDTWTPVRTT
ncbi:MAG TPA: GHMP kinase [Actinomycetota bacterium]|jgi:D-glycero-alpha-D-manno-heptose-7-phosphate kinase